MSRRSSVTTQCSPDEYSHTSFFAFFHTPSPLQRSPSTGSKRPPSRVICAGTEVPHVISSGSCGHVCFCSGVVGGDGDDAAAAVATTAACGGDGGVVAGAAAAAVGLAAAAAAGAAAAAASAGAAADGAVAGLCRRGAGALAAVGVTAVGTGRVFCFSRPA